MTTIDRLGITGIRSYGADEETFIRFYRPLTIILGRNGSGKSTIIEAVKMATTGDLPPMVDKGAAFIHDPRIDNETETKAKIRLQFTNARGDQYVVSRHFLLSIKRGLRGAKYKTEFKTLDQTLKRSNGEGPGSTSTFRCADLNALLPEIMRVTKPILNNVIFVHQEDSLWPLGDPKKLKEKFDDIFAATRYTKALETIRKFRKEQSADLRVLNADLARFEERVQLLDKLRNEAEKMRVDQDKLGRGTRVLEAEAEDLRRQKEEALAIVEEYSKSKLEMAELIQEVSFIEKSQTALESRMSIHIKDMDMARLRAERQRLEVRLQSINGERAERQRAIAGLEQSIQSKETDLQRRLQRQGALQHSESEHKTNLESLEAMKRHFHQKNFLSSAYPGSANSSSALRNLPVPESSTEEWSAALARFVQDAERSVLRLEKAKEEAVGDALASLNSAKVNVRSAETSIVEKKKARKEHGSALEGVRLALQGMGNAQMRLQESKEREAIARKAYQERKSSTAITKLDEERYIKRKEIQEATEELDSIRQQQNQLIRDEQLRTKLEVCRKSVQRTELELKTALELLSDKLIEAKTEVEDAEKLVPSYMSSENRISVNEIRSVNFGNSEERNQHQGALLEFCDNASQRGSSLLAYLNVTVAELSSKASTAAARQSLLKRQAKDLEKKVWRQEVELANARKELLKAPRVDESPTVEDLTALFQQALVVSDGSGCGISSTQVEQVEKTAKNVDQEVAAAQQRASLSFAYARFAQDDLDKFESNPKHACPTCGLSSAKKVESMRKRMQEKVERHKNPNDQAKEENVIKKLECTSAALKKVRNTGSLLVSHMETYLPSKEALEKASTVAKDAENRLREMSEIARTVKVILGENSATGQLRGQRAEVLRLASSLSQNVTDLEVTKESMPASAHEEHSMAEINEKLTVVESRRRHLQVECDDISKSLDRERELLDDANHRLHVAMDTREKMQEKANDCVKAEEEKVRLITLTNELDTEISALQLKLADYESNLSDAELAHSVIVGEQDRLVHSATTAMEKSKSKVSKWNDLTARVGGFVNSGFQNELATLLKSISGIQEDITVHKQDLMNLRQEAQTSSNSENGIQSSMSNIDANISHMENDQIMRIRKRSIKHLEDDINRIRGQVEGGDPNAMVNAIHEKMQQCGESLAATKAMFNQLTKMYEMKQKDQVEAERDGSRKLYDECRIQKQTMELASTDLDMYHRALDQALMAFHTLKMNSINRIIKELWQQTYRGTDIDEIEITSDAGEALGSGTSSTARRNYNYRVMMRQGQAQLDMRGRCSAGQKVLACLVIRLALAESFCTDCGILALDEPTVSLDHENIESLALALKSIIQHRRKQRNFQLVLITHDREFIDMIGARDFADEFYMESLYTM